MQDSEEQYTPRKRVNRPLDDEDYIEIDEPSRVPARSSRMSGRQSTAKRYAVSRTPQPLQTERSLRYALIAGGIGGILDVLLTNVAVGISSITSHQTASALFGLLFLNLFITTLILGITGYIIGRTTLQRRLGFVAGAVIGTIAYFISFLVRYIPNYPGNTTTSSATNVATIGIGLLLLLISALLAGLVSLFGAWLATRGVE